MVDFDLLDAQALTQLADIVARSAWKGSKRELHRRLTKLFRSEFSVRDTKLLKRIAKTHIKEGAIDYDELMYKLPGKTQAQIQVELSKYSLFVNFSKRIHNAGLC